MSHNGSTLLVLIQDVTNLMYLQKQEDTIIV